MTRDYFVFLVQNNEQQESPVFPEGLASGFVDKVSVWFFERDKVKARRRYVDHAGRDIDIPNFISQTEPNFSSLPSPNWLAFQVDFELLTPCYSKDDRVFHLMDNPVRKDRLYGVPFMAASSWKGMLRWACRMQEGLVAFLESGKSFEQDWRDPDWIVHLFGNEKGESEEFNRGALVFYPTWFDRIGFEVINPHSRERRAGTQPIYYEVVPPGAKGTLSLLYAPWPGMKPEAKATEVLPKLFEAMETLLTNYGISAKRTVGWGTAKIGKWCACQKTREKI
ncbi:MAG: hypothetical protein D6816_12785, partial [Bacteroidetes bacterium]